MSSQDLTLERTADPTPFTEFLYTPEDTRIHKFSQKLLWDEPAFNQGIKTFDYTRGELLNLGMQQSGRWAELIQQGLMDPEDTGVINLYMPNTIEIFTHQFMFVPCLEDLGTPEQFEKWAVPAKVGKIIGTYNQTEIGHGSDVQRLETTATYDPATQEFILNSPTITSTKVWAAGLGFAMPYCVCQIQTYTQGKYVGLQTFFVQLRDAETWEPMPGVEIGELGPKIGVPTIDNGWMRFKNYRVPRENMLAKLNEVQPNGTFVKKLDSRIGYGSMMRIRAGIVACAAIKLSKAAVITTRYSVIRRQFPTSSGEERKVLDYQMQSTRVLTQLANAFVFKVVTADVYDFTWRVIDETKQGNFENLGNLHSELSCFKSFASKIAQDGIEILRQCCGGHGFSVWSGIPHLWGEISAQVTYEGENHMLYMQTTRKLLRCMGQVLQGQQLHEKYAFLGENVTSICNTTPHTFFDPENLVNMLKLWTISKLQSILSRYSPEEIAEQQVEMYEATFAHFLYRYASIFASHLAKADQFIKTTLQHILTTFVIQNWLPYVGSLLALGVLQSREAYTHMRQAMSTSIGEIRKSAVVLTDAFDYTDEELNSALGCYDGDAYNRLFECYKGARFNSKEERQKIDGALKYLRPLSKL